ncbi:MAG: hypothetical protein ACRDZQ_09065, partial [Acidimicrobiales bacterium]
MTPAETSGARAVLAAPIGATAAALTPEFVTWGRLDEVEVIGAAISALVGGKSGPEVAKGLGGPDKLP